MHIVLITNAIWAIIMSNWTATSMHYSIFCKKHYSLKSKLFFLLFLFTFGISFSHTAFAQYQRYSPGDTVTIGEFVYDDNYSATTTPCWVTIYDSTSTQKVNNATMTAEATGWHYYSYSLASDAALGNWPTSMTCGTALAGDLIKTDRTFTVASAAVSTSSIASAVWNSGTRTLSSLGSVVSDIWNFTGRTLTDYGSSTVASTTAYEVWNRAVAGFASPGTFGKLLADNIDAQISSRGTSSLTADEVWNATTRTLTNYSTTSIASAIWSNATRRLTDSTLSSGGSLVTNTDLTSSLQIATSGIFAEILANRNLINGLNDISATDIWTHASRSLTDYGSSTNAASLASTTAYEVWNRAAAQLTTSGSIGKRLADNIDAQISSRSTSTLTAADVWSVTSRTLTDYSTSSIVSAVWGNSARTLTQYGNDITAADVWNTLTSSLNTVNSIGKRLADNIDTTTSSRASLANQTATWLVTMSDYSSVQNGSTYRAKVSTLNSSSIAQDVFAAPEITLYDADRNVVVSSVPMTDIGAGLYEYTYSVSSGASQGVWESVVETEVESGKIITTNDYWLVAGSPAQVIINSVTATSTPNVSANLTITNEGLAGYEYQYEWCVVSQSDNACGGGNDVYHGTGAKFINPGEDWNTNLTATVSTAGSYYFKVVVYFGTESSGSSRSFTITSDSTPDPTPTPSPGGGGGGGGAPAPTPVPTPQGACKGADLNGDNNVNSVDFSILLAFWKTAPPFKNTCVDINKDRRVDSIDFSILLSQWGTAGKAL